MKTLSLLDNKLHLDSSGSIVLATGEEGLRQKIETRLSLYLGEFWLDVDSGVPYIQRILGYANRGENGIVNSVTQILDSEILKESEVISIKNSEASFNPITRSFTYTVSINTIYGLIEMEV